jgi:DNA-binding NarL/FixJ family response regulator
LKDNSPVELEFALRTVVRGESYLSPAVSRHVIDGYVQRITPPEPVAPPVKLPGPQLSSRQMEILKLIAQGFTSKDIARQTGLKAKTVDSHRTNLMNELNIHDIAGLVRYAIRIGLVSVE